MKAVIMAGGEGTRLRPLTSNIPKPMMPLANRPMMEHIVRLLRQHGFTDIVVTLAFLPQAIRTYFGDGSEFGVTMRYATEEMPLGTAGSVRNAMDELDERFLVISGDVLTDIDLSSLVKHHEQTNAFATICLRRVTDPVEFGIVITREDGTVERFLEKPTWGQVFSDTINTGIYVLEPGVFDFIAEGKPVDFSADVFPALLDAGHAVYGHVLDGYWEDVGTLEAYSRAHQDVLDGKVEVGVEGFRLGEGIWLGEGAEVDPAARLDGPAIIGDYCRIEAGAHLRPYTVLGANVLVGPDAFLERTVVHDNTYIGPAVRLRGTVVGRAGDLRRGVRCEEGVVLGDECFVGEHAVLNPGVKVYPFKTVEPGAIINSSIVWESRGARHVFGRHGVSGLANVDISPELAVKVAMAYGTTLKKGATVVASRDSSRAGRALKRAVMVGLNATGVNVLDLEAATVPLTRFELRSARAQGGVTVRLLAYDPQSVTITFFDEEGIDIDEGAQRKVERLFHREDFRRSFAADIGDIGFPPRALEYYTAALMQSLDVAAIRAARLKLVLDYSAGTTSFVMPSVLAKIGAEVLARNPYASTLEAAAYDPRAQGEEVGRLVAASGAHVGAVLDPDGERLTLVDDTGHVLSNDECLLAILTLLIETQTAPIVALPVAVSQSAERLIASAGGSIVWTKLSASDLMVKASDGGVVFGASQDAGYIFPSFLPAYDSTAALLHVLGLLAASGRRLSEVVHGLPRVHISHEEIVTPWEQKGLVMRTLIERNNDRPLVLVDGVKIIHDDGWALVLPDPDEPLTHIWAEGPTEGAARALAQEYARRMRQLLH
ncbi:MAG: sugar phosphate nucleotidyltransferase [Acidimicrobiales bacterium]